MYWASPTPAYPKIAGYVAISPSIHRIFAEIIHPIRRIFAENKVLITTLKR